MSNPSRSRADAAAVGGGFDPLDHRGTLRGGLDPGFKKLAAETVIADRYRLVSQLGGGGFGVVWKVEDLATRPDERSPGDFFALKLLAPQLRDNERALALVRLEAQRCMQLVHPNIVRTYDFVPDGTYPAIKMELLTGQSLDELLSEAATEAGEPAGLGMDATLEIIGEVVAALNHAHQAETQIAGRPQRGMVHRDLKPANVYLHDTKEGTRVKLLDFGISQEVHSKLSQQNAADNPLNTAGTPEYMSPQHFAGHAADPRDDVWGLGVLMYECLTGRVPWRAEVVRSGQCAEFPPAKPAELSKAQWRVLLGTGASKGALQVDPMDRFESPAAFWDAFLEATAKSSTSEGDDSGEAAELAEAASPVGDGAGAAVLSRSDVPASARSDTPARIAEGERNNPWRFVRHVITAVYGLACLALIGWFCAEYVVESTAPDDVSFGEFLSACIEPANLPYTLFLGLMLLYWLFVVAGFFAPDTFDFDLDLDPDVDFDADIDTEVGHGGHFAISMLNYFNLGEVPLMVLLAVLAMSTWALSLLATHYLGDASAVVLPQLIVPTLLIGLFATKVVTAPLKPLFASDLQSFRRITGRTCTVTSIQVTTEFGLADIATGGVPTRIMVRTAGEEVLKKGDEAVVKQFDAEKKAYIVTKS